MQSFRRFTAANAPNIDPGPLPAWHDRFACLVRRIYRYHSNRIYSAVHVADKQVFNGLDALRGYAAITVVLFHGSALLGAPWLVPSGYLAVDLFFLMSGFVIAHSYEDRILQRGWRWFMKIRMIRFLPLYALGGFLGLSRVAALLVVGSDTQGWISAAIAYFMFLPAPPSPFSGGTVAPLNDPAWSLLFELYANLALALLLPWLRNSTLVLITLATAGVLIVASLQGHPLLGPQVQDFAWGFARTFFSICLGVLIYRFRHRIPRFRVHPLVLPLLVLTAFQIPDDRAFSLVFVLFISPAIMIVALCANTYNRASWYGARASFALYAIHQPLMSLASGVASRLGASPDAMACMVIVACVLIAPFLDLYYDRPLRRFLGLRGSRQIEGARPS